MFLDLEKTLNMSMNINRLLKPKCVSSIRTAICSLSQKRLSIQPAAQFSSSGIQNGMWCIFSIYVDDDTCIYVLCSLKALISLKIEQGPSVPSFLNS